VEGGKPKLGVCKNFSEILKVEGVRLTIWGGDIPHIGDLAESLV